MREIKEYVRCCSKESKGVKKKGVLKVKDDELMVQNRKTRRTKGKNRCKKTKMVV